MGIGLATRLLPHAKILLVPIRFFAGGYMLWRVQCAILYQFFTQQIVYDSLCK